MSETLRISVFFLALSITLAFFRPNLGPFPLIVGAILFGFISYLEKREDSKLESLEKDLKDLKGKVDSLTLGRAIR